MDTPKDKTELIERIRQEYAALERTIGELHEEQMTAKPESGWSVKDNLAHIAAWQGILRLFHIGGRPLAGAPPPVRARELTGGAGILNEPIFSLRPQLAARPQAPK